MAQTLEITFDDDNGEGLRIAGILGGEGERRTERLQGFVEAAVEEYSLTMSGRKAVTGVSGQRELRLYLLYKHLDPVGGLSDRQVEELFQLTRSQARTLIAGTWARYREELQEQLSAAVEKALKHEEAKWDERKHLLIRLPGSLAKYVREVVDETNAPPVDKVREVAGTYDLSEDTVSALCAQLGIPTEGILPEEE
jgi:hypothetical protein